MEEIRLQKYLSECGILSRRAAEKEIESGNITVNGDRVPLGTKITPGRDEVRYRGKKVHKSINRDKKVYIMLNKPRGYVTTMSDDLGRKCVAALVASVGMRVYPVGRLDKNSEGLLLLTNDGEFANYMMHPSHEIPKIYHVRVRGEVPPKTVEKLSKITDLADGTEILPVQCKTVLKDETSTVIEMRLYEGKNREIRKICDEAELTIIRLQRVAIGEVDMGGLKVGEWKHLTRRELRLLGYQPFVEENEQFHQSKNPRGRR